MARGAWCGGGGSHLESTLDLVHADPPHLHVADVDFRSLPEDADEAAWRSAHEVFARLWEDAPDNAAGGAPMPYPLMRAFLHAPWQLYTALRGGKIIGVTAVFVKNAASREVNTMLTGVEREWRGRGIATALKAAHAAALREAGWRLLVTQNMAGNDPILAANRRLGFRSGRTILDATLELR